MPRVENIGPSVDRWCEATGEGATTVDVCGPCWNDLLGDPHYHDEVLDVYVVHHPGEPKGEDGWGGEVSHPPYEDEGDYTCEVCGQPLTGEDDW